MALTNHEYQVLLDVVRQNYASVVWTHKIQEKQIDIYTSYYKKLQIVNILFAPLTSIGIIFVGDSFQFAIKAFTLITLFILTIFKSFDLNNMSGKNKEADNKFFVIRNEIL